jgi:AcrR family transcriptional regulator
VSTKPQTVRRRNRQEVEAAVREALLRLLSDGIPFKNLTVDELARAAGLSRTAFYFYFPGKEQALMSAATEVTAELYERADAWWHGEGPPEQRVRTALQGILQVYVEHASLLRATVELTGYNREFEDFYKGLLDRFVRATADHLRRENEAGRLRPLDCEVVAEELVWMAERSNHVLIKQGRSPEELVDAMTSIWVHALYPDESLSAGS